MKQTTERGMIQMDFDDIKNKLTEALESGLGEEATARLKKMVRSLTEEIDTTLEWHFKDITAPAHSA
jgi:hypothetical protein